MALKKILEQLFGPFKDRHRLVVDSQVAEPVALEETVLICKLKQTPQSLVAVDIYLGFTDTEDEDLKTGQYHLSGEILKVEDALGDWCVSIRLLSNSNDLVKRRSDRWPIDNFPIRYRRSGSAEEHAAKMIDFSAEGIGIERQEPLQVGEVLEIFGLAEAMEMDFDEPSRFEVRVLPAPRKAGLMLAEGTSAEMKSKLLDFSIQLRQVNRFWNSFMDNIRVKVGRPAQSSVLPSVDFVARQLRRKMSALKMLIDERRFEELADSLNLLERFERLMEDIAQLEEEKKKLIPLCSGKRNLLLEFLEKRNPTK